MEISFLPEFMDYYKNNIEKHTALEFVPGVSEYLGTFTRSFYEFSGLLGYATEIIEETKDVEIMSDSDYSSQEVAAQMLVDMAIEAQRLNELAKNVYDGMRIIACILEPIAVLSEDAGTDPAEDPERREDPAEGVQLPTREEMRVFWQQQRKLDEWAQSLTAEQLCKLSDAGYYNSSMKGYCIRAAREMGLDDDQTRTLLRCFSYALDVMNKDDAERLYNSSQF